MIDPKVIDDSSSCTSDSTERLKCLLEKESKPAYFSTRNVYEAYSALSDSHHYFEMDGFSLRRKCIDWICKLQRHFRKSNKVAHVAINYLDRFLCSEYVQRKLIDIVFKDSNVDILTLSIVMAFDCAVRIHSEDSGDGVRSAIDCAERELGVHPLYRCDEVKHMSKRRLIREKLASSQYYNRDGFQSLLDAFQDIVEATYSHPVDVPSVKDCTTVQYAVLDVLHWFLDPPLVYDYMLEMMSLLSPTLYRIAQNRGLPHDELRRSIFDAADAQLSSLLRYGNDAIEEGPMVVSYAAVLNALHLVLCQDDSRDIRDVEELAYRLEFYCQQALDTAFSKDCFDSCSHQVYQNLDLNWKHVISFHIGRNRVGEVANHLFYLHQRQKMQITKWIGYADNNATSGTHQEINDVHESTIVSESQACEHAFFVPGTPHCMHDHQFDRDICYGDTIVFDHKALSDRAPSAIGTDESCSESNISFSEEDHAPFLPYVTSSFASFSEMIPNDRKHRVINSSYSAIP